MILVETMRSFMRSEENVSSAFTCNVPYKTIMVLMFCVELAQNQ